MSRGELATARRPRPSARHRPACRAWRRLFGWPGETLISRRRAWTLLSSIRRGSLGEAAERLGPAPRWQRGGPLRRGPASLAWVGGENVAVLPGPPGGRRVVTRSAGVGPPRGGVGIAAWIAGWSVDARWRWERCSASCVAWGVVEAGRRRAVSCAALVVTDRAGGVEGVVGRWQTGDAVGASGWLVVSRGAFSDRCSWARSYEDLWIVERAD
jgi:hypothetical protein